VVVVVDIIIKVEVVVDMIIKVEADTVTQITVVPEAFIDEIN